jgi:hypothetical protein
MTLVRKLRAHPCKKSLLGVENKDCFHLVGVLAPATVHSMCCCVSAHCLQPAVASQQNSVTVHACVCMHTSG